jgi:hypothetical protein
MRNKLTHDEPTLFIDQYGHRYWASNLKELREQVCPYAQSHAQRMYRDTKSAGTVWVGYVVGSRWLEAFKPVREKAS